MVRTGSLVWSHKLPIALQESSGDVLGVNVLTDDIETATKNTMVVVAVVGYRPVETMRQSEHRCCLHVRRVWLEEEVVEVQRRGGAILSDVEAEWRPIEADVVVPQMADGVISRCLDRTLVGGLVTLKLGGATQRELGARADEHHRGVETHAGAEVVGVDGILWHPRVVHVGKHPHEKGRGTLHILAMRDAHQSDKRAGHLKPTR